MSKFIANSELKVLIITDSYDELVHENLLPSGGTTIVEYRQNRYQIQQCSLISLEICLQENPDCVLLDWELPNLDGEEGLQHILSKQIPVIILVSAANEQLVSRIEQDYQDYLVKETLTKELIFSALRNAICSRDDRGLALLSIETDQDIRNRKITEATLGESEARFERIALSLPGVIFTVIHRADGTPYFEYISSGIEKLHEITVEQVLEDGDLIFQQHYPEDRARFRNDIARSIETMSSFIHESQIITPSGKVKWIQISSFPEISSELDISLHKRRVHGNIAQHGIVLDITDRKLVEMQLQQQIDYQKILSSISQKIRASLNLEEILSTTVAEVHQLLQSDRVLVYQIYADGTGAVVAESVSPRFSSVLNNIYPEETFPEEMYDIYLRGKIYSLEDIETGDVSPCLVEFLREMQVRAKLVIPIIQEQKLWGLLIAHQCDRSRAWQDSEIELLKQLSSQFAIAIQQAHLFQQLQLELHERQQAEQQIRQQADRESLLHGIMQRIRQSLDLNTIFEVATPEIRQFLQADRVCIFKFDPDSNFDDGEVVAESVVEEFNSVLSMKFHDHCFSEKLVEVSQHGRAYFMNDINNSGLEQCYIDILSEFQIRANLVVPLLSGNTFWGLLCIHQCSAPRDWELTEISLVQQIGNQLAIAIQQAHLFQQLQLELRDRQRAEQQIRQQANRESLLHDLMQRIRQSLDLHTIFDTATLEIRQFLQADRVGIFKFLPNSNFNDGEFVAESVVPEFDSVVAARFHDDCFGGEYAESYHHGRFQAVDDIYNAGLHQCHIDILSVFQIRANLVVPLLNGNDLWGLLCIHQCSAPRHWEIEEISLVQQISSQIAIAIQQAHLFQQLQIELRDRQRAEQQIRQQANRESLLHDLMQRIRQSLDLHTIFDTATLEIRQFLQADRVGIFKFLPNSNFNDGEFVAESVVPEFDSVVAAKFHDDCFGDNYAESYHHGAFLAVDDIYNAGLQQCHIDILAVFQIRANLVVPLLNGNDLWGLLCIHQCAAPRHWEIEEISLVRQISSQLAIAIQQASLYQQVQEELANKDALYLQLANELHQKKVLLKEVHHRVKNNLQVMSSLLRMQFRKTTPELKVLIEDYQNRIQSMALIHAQLHNNEDLANINFRDYIADLMANLFQCYVNHSGNIEYKLDVINIFLPLEQSIPVGLIINELISNTLKYAFPHGSGEINIQLTQTETQYHLIVADDGIGLPLGLDIANTESLGMQLVHSLTDQLEGTLLCNSDNGTKFQVFFPVF
jgi:GAF domain-containing protein/CheY-like chemotaxis protein